MNSFYTETELKEIGLKLLRVSGGGGKYRL